LCGGGGFGFTGGCGRGAGGSGRGAGGCGLGAGGGLCDGGGGPLPASIAGAKEVSSLATSA